MRKLEIAKKRFTDSFTFHGRLNRATLIKRFYSKMFAIADSNESAAS